MFNYRHTNFSYYISFILNYSGDFLKQIKYHSEIYWRLKYSFHFSASNVEKLNNGLRILRREIGKQNMDKVMNKRPPHIDHQTVFH